MDVEVYNAGALEEVFKPDLFRGVFGLKCCIMKSPADQKPMCRPTRLCGKGAGKNNIILKNEGLSRWHKPLFRF
ncbi:hypothetical protein DX928_16820 [Bacillus swezeyi]|nr:hypothetical protein DX928_16820 [Bacillus swezeyi]